MNMNTKFAIRSAAALSIGMLLATTACTDYAEEFKNDDNNKIYAEAEIVEDFETPFFSFDSANVVWQGYDNKEFNSATIADRAPFATSDGSSQVEYRGRDENGKNYTTNTLPSDLSNLIRRSGGIAGKLIKNDSKSSFVQIIFPTGENIDYSDESKVSGLAVAMASEYGSTEICLLSISEDNKRIYKQYCTAITEKFGKDSTVYAAKVSIKELADAAGKNFGIFLPTANAIGIKISGSNEASFGFNIVGVGTYHDESTAISSSSKEDDEEEEISSSSEDADSEKDSNDDSSSSEEAKSSSSVKQSSSSKTVSSSSEAISSSSVSDLLYWNGFDGSDAKWNGKNLTWVLDGNYSPIWTVPEGYDTEDAAATLSKVIDQECYGLCSEVAPKRDTAILRLDIGPENLSDKSGLCVTYTNASANIKLQLISTTGAKTSYTLPKTPSTEYKLWDIAWTDFSGSTEKAVKNLSAIEFVVTNPNLAGYRYINIYEFGEKGSCTGKTRKPVAGSITFSKKRLCDNAVFNWDPYQQGYCNPASDANCTKRYPDTDLHMCLDGEIYDAQWEDNSATELNYGGLGNLEESLAKEGSIYADFLESGMEDYELSFKLSDDGSSRDITHWQGICLDYLWTPNATAEVDYAKAKLVVSDGTNDYYTVLPTDPSGYVIKCFMFDKFKNSDGNTATITKANKISFKFEDLNNLRLFHLRQISEFKVRQEREYDKLYVGDLGTCSAENSTVTAGSNAKWIFHMNADNELGYKATDFDNAKFKWINMSKNMPDTIESTGSYTKKTLTSAETNTGVMLKLTMADGHYQNINCGYVQTTDPLCESSNNNCFFWEGSLGYALGMKHNAGAGTEEWYFTDDHNDGGQSAFIWPVPPNEGIYSMAPIIDNCNGVCGNFELNKGTLLYNPNLRIGFEIAGPDADGVTQTADVSEWRGICIRYTSSIPAYMDMRFLYDVEKDMDEDYPFVTLGKTLVPQTMDFAWSKFKQAGWGGSKITGVEASKILRALELRFQAADGTKGNFNILEVGSYGKCTDGATAPPPVFEESAVSDVAVNATGNLWTQKTDSGRVNTGIDAGTNSSGYLYTFDDASDGGASLFTWKAPTNKDALNELAPAIEACDGALCGGFTLNKNAMTFNPYLGIGFDIAGKDSDGDIQPADVTDWEGICIVYSSDVAMTAILDVGEDLNTELGYDLPFVSLPKSTSGVMKEFTWSQFRQAGWGSGRMTGTTAATVLQAIKFQWQAADKTQGTFRIHAIGKKDGCTME